MTSIGALMNLKGRSALVTGAAGAIGTVIAHGLAELGADLVLVDRAEAPLANLAEALKASWPVSVHAIACISRWRTKGFAWWRRPSRAATGWQS